MRVMKMANNVCRKSDAGPLTQMQMFGSQGLMIAQQRGPGPKRREEWVG